MIADKPFINSRCISNSIFYIALRSKHTYLISLQSSPEFHADIVRRSILPNERSEYESTPGPAHATTSEFLDPHKSFPFRWRPTWHSSKYINTVTILSTAKPQPNTFTDAK